MKMILTSKVLLYGWLAHPTVVSSESENSVNTSHTGTIWHCVLIDNNTICGVIGVQSSFVL